jgi:hypothetical protein
VDKTDDIRSVNYIFANLVSGWKEIGRVDWSMKCEKKLICHFECFKRRYFLNYPLYSLAMWNPILAANKHLYRQNVLYKTMFVHNWMNIPHTGFLKICLTLLMSS